MRAAFIAASRVASRASLRPLAVRRAVALGMGIGGGAVALCAPASAEPVNYKAVYGDIAAMFVAR